MLDLVHCHRCIPYKWRFGIIEIVRAGIVTGYGLDDRMIGVRFPVRAGNFSLRHRVQTGSGAQPPSYQIDTGALSLGVKQPGREADYSTSI
jgi:hypothetical protein